MTTGVNLIHKWIDKSLKLGMSVEEIENTSFVYGDAVYSVTRNEEGEFDFLCKPGRVVVFREMKDLNDEYTCRICGAEYDNKKDVITCCTNQDE